ncbi:MAG: hypothetical protein NC308_09195 [Clostridium sp.]|nr:hypothetical protein [Bacteroides sp.]MCM1199051.1 hypothetical protein [Clostridium sp.]
MKRNIAQILMSVLILALYSCTDDGLSRQNAGKQKPEINVETNNVSNYLMTFTVSTDFLASQFGYVVMEGNVAAVPSAQSILMGEVGTALQSGVFNTADKTRTRIEFECRPDQDYRIFASAITDTGLLSDVFKLDVHVNDTEAPEISGTASVSGNILTLTFSEEIFVDKDSYATIQYVKFGSNEITPKQDLPLEYITTSGNQAVFNCPKPGNGAGYIVSFPQGLFVDRSGNKAKGVESSYDKASNTYRNLGWDDANVEFAVETSYFMDGQSFSWKEGDHEVSIVFPFDVYKNTGLSNAVSIVYNEAERKEYVYADYSVADDHRTVTITLPRAPKATFDVRLEWGAVYDEWANGSAEYEVSTEEFKYAVERPGFGEYSLFSEKGQEFNVKFSYTTAALMTMESDWFNIGRDVFGNTGTIMPALKGTVDYEKRTVTFDGEWYYRGALYPYNAFGNGFYYYGNDESRMLVFWGGGASGKEPITVHFDENGKMTDIGAFDYSIHASSNMGIINVYDSVKDGTGLTFIQ